MKKIFLLFALLMSFCATCKAATASEARTLVMYYTYSGVTETLAQNIADECGGTLLQVVDHGNYPRPESQQTYNYANNERSQINAGNWPEINTSVEDFDDWDFIIICTPLWNGKMANPMLTFLHNHADKLHNKQVALAVTSWSSGITQVINDAHNMLPDCVFLGNPLHINYNHRDQMNEMATEWLTTLDVTLPVNDKMRVTVGNKSFRATLANNNTAEEFKEMLPLTITMNELNGNEKYYYFSDVLTADASVPDMIHAGDIMLYGRNCLVLFYETFKTSYSYTRIGSIDDPTGLAEALGNGNPTVTFELLPDLSICDFNHDGSVDIDDIVVLINEVLGKGSNDMPVKDLNFDGSIDVADVTFLISLVLNK